MVPQTIFMIYRTTKSFFKVNPPLKITNKPQVVIKNNEVNVFHCNFLNKLFSVVR